MKIGVSAFAWYGKLDSRSLDILPTVKALGVDVFEIPMFSPADLEVPAIRSAFKQNGLECTVCAILPSGINPISADPVVRKNSLHHLKLCVETTAELGANLLGGPLFAPIGYLPDHRPTRDEWQWAVEAFQALGDTLHNANVTLSLEPVNRSETFFLRTAKEARALCEAIGDPRIGVTIDTFHANIEEKRIPEAIQSLGSHLRHMHMSESDRGILGQGHVDFPNIIRVLRAMNYQGVLMIEGFGYSAEVLDAPGTLWAELDVSPLEIAGSGVEYLRTLLREAE
jgi:D-psicose/D-tagatose/L-ribulose 3-epimerase